MDIGDRDEHGNTVLMRYLITNNKKGIKQVFESIADTNSQNVKELLSAVNNDGDTALIIAVKYNRIRAARLLINTGLSMPFKKNKDGMTALDISRQHNQKLLEKVLEKIQFEVDEMGLTDLMLLTENGDEYGAMILYDEYLKTMPDTYWSHTTIDKRTLLHIAIKSECFELAELLLENRLINTGAVDASGKTAYYIIYEMYLDTDSKRKKREYLDFINVLEQSGRDLNVFAKEYISNYTVLHNIVYSPVGKEQLALHVLSIMNQYGELSDQDKRSLSVLALTNKYHELYETINGRKPISPLHSMPKRSITKTEKSIILCIYTHGECSIRATPTTLHANKYVIPNGMHITRYSLPIGTVGFLSDNMTELIHNTIKENAAEIMRGDVSALISPMHHYLQRNVDPNIEIYMNQMKDARLNMQNNPTSATKKELHEAATYFTQLKDYAKKAKKTYLTPVIFNPTNEILDKSFEADSGFDYSDIMAIGNTIRIITQNGKELNITNRFLSEGRSVKLSQILRYLNRVYSNIIIMDFSCSYVNFEDLTPIRKKTHRRNRLIKKVKKTLKHLGGAII